LRASARDYDGVTEPVVEMLERYRKANFTFMTFTGSALHAYIHKKYPCGDQFSPPNFLQDYLP
jgi:hypothetical protein